MNDITVKDKVQYVLLTLGGWMICHFSIPFCFLLIEFHCAFSIIKYYNILFIIIIFWLGRDRPPGLRFFRACFFLYSCLSSYHLRLFLYLISFLLFPCVSDWDNSCMSTQFHIAILNGTCFFSTVQLQVYNVYSERKTRNSCALVNLCL